MSCKFKRSILTEHVDRSFSRGIATASVKRNQRIERRNINDRTALTLRDHLSRLMFHTVEYTFERKVDDGLIIIGGQIDDCTLRAAAGNVHANVEPAETLNGFRYQILHIGFLRHIRRDADKSIAEL